MIYQYTNSSIVLKVAVVVVRPFIYVDPPTKKITIEIKEFASVLDMLPKNLVMIPIITRSYEVGISNATGHYNGLLGMIQRKVADMAMYPIPIDISKPPGEFLTVLYESGTQIVSMTYFAGKKRTDLIDSVMPNDWMSGVLVIFVYFLIAFLVHKLFDKKNNIYDSLFLIYRITFKEHNLTLLRNGRLILSFILIYHLLLVFTVESSVNTQLVVQPPSQLIDSIDDLWKDESRRPRFVKDHFSNDYFIHSHGNKKAEDIYQRALGCNCVVNTQETLALLAQDFRSKIDRSSAIICEQMMISALRKIICNKDPKYLLEIGTFHSSPLIFKTLFSILHRFGLEKRLLRYINYKILISIEAGIAARSLKNIEDSNYGYIKPIGRRLILYKDCLLSNTPKSISNTVQVQIKNIVILNSFVFAIFFGLLFAFSINWIVHLMVACLSRRKTFEIP